VVSEMSVISFTDSRLRSNFKSSSDGKYNCINQGTERKSIVLQIREL